MSFKCLIIKQCLVAFIAAYGACLLVVALPIIILELSVGQLTGRGPVQAFYNICPVFKGSLTTNLIVYLLILRSWSCTSPLVIGHFGLYDSVPGLALPLRVPFVLVRARRETRIAMVELSKLHGTADNAVQRVRRRCKLVGCRVELPCPTVDVRARLGFVTVHARFGESKYIDCRDWTLPNLPAHCTRHCLGACFCGYLFWSPLVGQSDGGCWIEEKAILLFFRSSHLCRLSVFC